MGVGSLSGGPGGESNPPAFLRLRQRNEVGRDGERAAPTTRQARMARRQCTSTISFRLFGMIEREFLRNERAHGVPGDRRLCDSPGIQKGGKVVGKELRREAGLGILRTG